MLCNAIQSAVKGVITNTYQSIGDEGISMPYALHEETDTPATLKSGVVGYEWNVEIGIVAETADQAMSLGVSVRTAVEALAGTTSNSTKIEGVEYLGSSPGFDESRREYLRLLQFTIYTENQ